MLDKIRAIEKKRVLVTYALVRSGSVLLAWHDQQHPSKIALHHYCRHLCPESEGCAAKRWIGMRPVQEPPQCATQGLNKNAESYIAQLREVWR